ncbi:MAG: DUF932 domain-containing protein [Lachnospiraceae bacterium]|nr:DUF932 domain-containing protein [Lachnospiraceae bacterium]
MPADLESMFYVRETPWHGLGTKVMEAPSSADALRLAGLDWKVVQESVYTANGERVPGFYANIRDKDRRTLGVVSDRYKVVQNEEAFAFTDALLGEGVRYETAGSLQNGRKVWILARLPHSYIISGEQVDPYLVFSNTHDGTGSIRAAVTPVRVVCCNTLNLALDTAKRSWACVHTGDIRGKITDARETLSLAGAYMEALGKKFDELQKKRLTDSQIKDLIEVLLPLEEEDSKKARNVMRNREDLRARYYDAPDLKGVGKNAYRFINAVSDFATHAKPIRRTANYQENLFARTIEGHPMIDKAYQMVSAA